MDYAANCTSITSEIDGMWPALRINCHIVGLSLGCPSAAIDTLRTRLPRSVRPVHGPLRSSLQPLPLRLKRASTATAPLLSLHCSLAINRHSPQGPTELVRVMEGRHYPTALMFMV